MRNENFPTLVDVPKVGSEYLKLKNGELVKWRSLDEMTQIFEIESSSGEVSSVHRRDVEIPTANEEIEFLSVKQK